MANAGNAAAPTPSLDDYKDATERLWKTYTTINEWIRFADAKAGALLATNGVLTATALGKLHWTVINQSTIPAALCIVGGLSLLASAICCLMCIKPTLALFDTGPTTPKSSTIYFEHIAERQNLNEYFDDVLKLRTEEDRFKEIATQVYAVSSVASRKHCWIFWSVAGLAIALLCAVLLSITFAMLPTIHNGKP